MARGCFNAAVSAATRKWRDIGADTTHGIRDTLAQLGAWQHEASPHNACKRVLRTGLPRIALALTVFIAYVMSPVSIYQFRGDDVIKIMEPTAALFIMSMLVVNIGSLLFNGDAFDRMMAALEQMKAFQRQQPPLAEALSADVRRFSRFALGFFTWTVPVTYPGLLFGYPMFAVLKRDLSFRYWFPYDLQASPYFELTVSTLTADLAFGSLVYFLTNSLFVSLLIEAIIQLKVVNHNMSNVCSHRKGATAVGRDFASQMQQGAAERSKMRHDPENPGPKAKIRRPENGGVREECADSRASADLSQAQQLRRRAELMRDVKDAEQQLRICVCHHQAINRFVIALNESFSLILIQLYANSVCPIILGVIALTNASEFDNRTFMILGLMVNQLLTQAVFCWLGHTITQQNALLRDSVFGCDWFDQSESFKRSMRIIMSRSNQPLEIKIGRFIPLNMPAFYQIIQVTYSYYMSLTATLEIKTVSE